MKLTLLQELEALICAKGAGRVRDCRYLTFFIGHLMVHELGHAFMTYLMRTWNLEIQGTTPRQGFFADDLWTSNPRPGAGEAGHTLERLIFGGRVKLKRFPDGLKDSVSSAFLL